eukprot:m.220842 g.220842  ORF g.220842 m.220842 type:complete len:51 (+) comp31441_c0_seq1:1340-1492(+)
MPLVPLGQVSLRQHMSKYEQPVLISDVRSVAPVQSVHDYDPPTNTALSDK